MSSVAFSPLPWPARAVVGTTPTLAGPHSSALSWDTALGPIEDVEFAGVDKPLSAAPVLDAFPTASAALASGDDMLAASAALPSGDDVLPRLPGTSTPVTFIEALADRANVSTNRGRSSSSDRSCAAAEHCYVRHQLAFLREGCCQR